MRHPEDQNGLAASWLYEAITETYIPLLAVAEGWLRDCLPAQVTVSSSPSLLEMLPDEFLLKR